MSDFIDYLEAYASGYNACRDGVPNEGEAFMAAARSSYEKSGGQIAKRIIDGTATEADHARSAELQRVWA